jgi:hypothetical protein
MSNHLLAVEGAHDAAFFAKLLLRRGFVAIDTIEEVPRFWDPLVPRTYPPADRNGRLERVITFPEFFHRPADGATFAVSVAGGDTLLLDRVRDALDVRDAPEFTSIGVVLDTDHAVDEPARFAEFLAWFAVWNQEGVADLRPGFPLPTPAGPRIVQAGAPRFGVFQLPGLEQQGALENVLLECAVATYPAINAAAVIYLDAVHAAYPGQATPVKKSRTASGRSKALCGVIANALLPGASLAVSLRRSEWVPQAEEAIPFVREAAAFLDALLAV